VIMLVSGGGAYRLVLIGPGLIALGPRCSHSLLSGLIPAGRADSVGPDVFGFERAHCRVKRDPIPIRRMGFVGFWMDLIQHDVNVEMLFVVVGNDNVLVVLVAKLVQGIFRSINPLCASRPFAWRPRQFVMAHCIVAT